jgi:NitT/TauT family transport system permease protein
VVLRNDSAVKTPPSWPMALLRRAWDTKELLFTLVAILIVWTLLVRTGNFHPIVLPSPQSVLGSLIGNAPDLAEATLVSFFEMLLGFALGGSAGFVLAVGIFYSPFLLRAVYPFLFGFRVVPKVAFLPLFLVWFGIGLTVKVVMAGTAVFFLILVQTLLGLSTVDPSLVELGKSLKMNERLMLRWIRLPAALPAIMVGAKLGITYALTNVVVAEMFTSTKGLGSLVVRARQHARTDLIIAVIIVTAAAGLIVYLTGRAVEKRATFWYIEEPT